jgi:hypothetical protein
MNGFGKLVPLLLGAFCFSAAAYADSNSNEVKGSVSRDMERHFQALDRDGDGALSEAETRQSTVPASGFNTADKNQDGKLDLGEFRVLVANASPDRGYATIPPSDEHSSAGSGSKR